MREHILYTAVCPDPPGITRKKREKKKIRKYRCILFLEPSTVRNIHTVPLNANDSRALLAVY